VVSTDTSMLVAAFNVLSLASNVNDGAAVLWKYNSINLLGYAKYNAGNTTANELCTPLHPSNYDAHK
jgi:hypothetical protein